MAGSWPGVHRRPPCCPPPSSLIARATRPVKRPALRPGAPAWPRRRTRSVAPSAVTIAGECSALLRMRVRVDLDAADAPSVEQCCSAGEQMDRRQHAARRHGHRGVDLQRRHRRRERDRCVVADHLGRDLLNHLGDHRVHLARHDRASGLQSGQLDLAEPSVRARIRATEGRRRSCSSVMRDDLQDCSGLDQHVLARLRLEVVARLGEGDAGTRAQSLGDQRAEAGGSVETRAHRGSAER